MLLMQYHAKLLRAYTVLSSTVYPMYVVMYAVMYTVACTTITCSTKLQCV